MSIANDPNPNYHPFSEKRSFVLGVLSLACSIIWPSVFWVYYTPNGKHPLSFAVLISIPPSIEIILCALWYFMFRYPGVYHIYRSRLWTHFLSLTLLESSLLVGENALMDVMKPGFNWVTVSCSAIVGVHILLLSLHLDRKFLRLSPTIAAMIYRMGYKNHQLLVKLLGFCFLGVPKSVEWFFEKNDKESLLKGKKVAVKDSSLYERRDARKEHLRYMMVNLENERKKGRDLQLTREDLKRDLISFNTRLFESTFVDSKNSKLLCNSSSLKLQPDSSAICFPKSKSTTGTKEDADDSGWGKKETSTQNSSWGEAAKANGNVANNESEDCGNKASTKVGSSSGGSGGWGKPKLDSGSDAGEAWDKGRTVSENPSNSTNSLNEGTAQHDSWGEGIVEDGSSGDWKSLGDKPEAAKDENDSTKPKVDGTSQVAGWGKQDVGSKQEGGNS